MKVSKTVEPTQWMTAPETVQIMEALNQREGQKALFVGGCVRHTLTAEEVNDIDIATTHTPQQVQALFKDTGTKVIPTGIEHGTVTIVINEKTFEVTTLRKDVETDGRRAVVAYTEDWLQDAQRRDFTMNTLLMDIAGNIFDPTGQGVDDLIAGQVIFVGNPVQRIAEDYLRILRFFRFHALYGNGKPDTKALSACRDAADKVFTLSHERITQEFFKILLSPRAVSILELMFENNILNIFSDESFRILDLVCDWQAIYQQPSLAARLLLLKADEQYLIMPKSLKKEIESIAKALSLPPMKQPHAVKVVVYKQGRPAAAQAFFIEVAQNHVSADFANDALHIINNWDIPIFPVTGDDLIKQGHAPGPDLGKKLKQMEEEWINQDFIGQIDSQ